MNRITREEIAVIAIFAAICPFAGSVIGWSVRTVSSRDRYLISFAERNAAEQQYYQKQINQIVTEGSGEKHVPHH